MRYSLVMKKQDDSGVWLVIGGLVVLGFTRPDLFARVIEWGAWGFLLIPLALLLIAILWVLIRALWPFILGLIGAAIGGHFYGEWGFALGIASAGWICWAHAWWEETYRTKQTDPVIQKPVR
jgi:hypothetical protein